MKNFKKQIKKFHHKSLFIIVILYGVAWLLPGRGPDELVSLILGVVGLLFAIIIGFFINDLWTRYQVIRENVAVEVSGLQTYFIFIKVLSSLQKDRQLVERQRDLVDEYVRRFFDVEWTDYGEIDPYFNRIIESLKDIKESKTNNEVETYTNLLPLLNEVTTSREKLFMYGKDKLSTLEWAFVYFLTAVLLFSIFFVNTGTITSIFLTGTLASAVAILVLILRDLNSLRFGEQSVSFEPYETIFDVIEMPRYYRKKDIDEGRVVPPENTEYRKF